MSHHSHSRSRNYPSTAKHTKPQANPTPVQAVAERILPRIDEHSRRYLNPREEGQVRQVQCPHCLCWFGTESQMQRYHKWLREKTGQSCHNIVWQHQQKDLMKQAIREVMEEQRVQPPVP